MSTDLINIIFGMKVRQARMETGLSLSEFAQRCELSPSYVTEIEKGRKYPKTDKILKMAETLDKDYDDLVSIKLDSSLTSLEVILSSPLLQHFPFEEFGLDVGNLVSMFTRVPDKASALLHAILEIGRQYDMKEEHFLRAALRSYQEIRENYFQDVEDAAVEFSQTYDLVEALPLKLDDLKAIIQERFGYQLDEMQLAKHDKLSSYRSVFLEGSQPKLLLNAALLPRQLKFLLAREMGYQFLGLKERSKTSTPDDVDSFQQVLNDFKASYFAGALIMPRAAILPDIQTFFQLDTWSPYRLLEMLERYDVTPEMLLYRFCELVPQFFGIKLHFLRFHKTATYRLVKQLNLSQRLFLPSGIGLYEHYCRRWLALRLLGEMKDAPDQFKETPLIGVQKSQFLDSNERFLSFGFARPLALSPNIGSSVIVGFRITPELSQTIHFVDDPAIPTVTINETCERCPLTKTQCTVRGAEPTLLQAETKMLERKAALNQLIAQLQT